MGASSGTILVFLYWRLVGCRNSAGLNDDLGSFLGGSVVEELLGLSRKGLAFLGYKDERTLNNIGAVLDIGLGRLNAAYGKGLDGLAYSSG